MDMQNIAFEYTDRPVSAWGGMRLMKKLVDRSGIRECFVPFLCRRVFPPDG